MPRPDTPRHRWRIGLQRGGETEAGPAGRCAPTEAFIEQVSQRGESVEVTLLLPDGSDGMASLNLHDWRWLEFRPGDIVPVRRLALGQLSA
jgi:hypothetical protein